MKALRIIGFTMFAMVIFLMISLVGGLIGGTIIKGANLDFNGSILFFITLVESILFFIGVLVCKIIDGKTNKDIFMFKKIDIKKVIYSIGIGLGMFVLSVGIMNILRGFLSSYEDTQKLIESSGITTLGIIGIVVIAPIFEEFFFRGFLLNGLRKYCSVGTAIIIQAVVFSIAHGNLIQSTYTLLLGIVLGLVLVHTESLVYPIIIHMVNNLVGGVISVNVFVNNPKIAVACVYIFIVLGILSCIKMLESDDSKYYVTGGSTDE